MIQSRDVKKTLYIYAKHDFIKLLGHNTKLSINFKTANFLLLKFIFSLKLKKKNRIYTCINAIIKVLVTSKILNWVITTNQVL